MLYKKRFKPRFKPLAKGINYDADTILMICVLRQTQDRKMAPYLLNKIWIDYRNDSHGLT